MSRAAKLESNHQEGDRDQRTRLIIKMDQWLSVILQGELAWINKILM